MTNKIFIIDALRTPIASFGGSLRNVSAVNLGMLLIKEIIKRSNLQKDVLDGVILGNVLQAGLGQNPARQCTLSAGLDCKTPTLTVNKVCGSALKAMDIAYRNILSGYGDLYIAGGMESMSNAPYLLNGARWGYKIGDSRVTDGMIKDGLWCPYNDIHMGSLVDDLAKEYNITRKAQDIFSLDSHIKAVEAIDDGKFANEIIPVDYTTEKGKKARFVNDEHPRKDTTLDKLSSLRPAFSSDGTVTAGNASGINDGAAALLIASAGIVEKLELKPLAEIISISEVGVEPKYFGTAPIDATKKALAMANLTIDDIELAELNEAFAAQTLIVMDKLGIDKKIVNVNGGAVAMGHPIGASGARIVVTLLHEMIRRDSKLGLASLCIGSGEGMAAIIKRVAR